MAQETFQPPTPFTEEETQHVLLGKISFWYFCEHVFARSFDEVLFRRANGTRGPFQLGELHKEWAILAQLFPRICVLAARMHLKSTVLGHAFSMWQMFKAESYTDGLYFSYKDELAAEHIHIIKRLVKANTYCRFWIDKKSTAESVINYITDFGSGPVTEVEMKASGIFAASRGRHPKWVICDDILSDFANPLEPTELERIERIFRNVVMSLPLPDDSLVLVGTPQSYDDILYKLSDPEEEFYWDSFPAIKDEVTQTTQWPEVWDYLRLQAQRRAVKDKAFSVEYQLIPTAAENAFFPMSDIVACVDTQLKQWSLSKEFTSKGLGVYGGIDVGKIVHPSHITIGLELPNRTLVVVYEEFIDHMKYNEQVTHINEVLTFFDATRCYFDNTYNALDDRGLTRKAYGRKFTKKLKADLLLALEKRIYAGPDEPGIILPNRRRYLSQIVQLDKRMNAPTTADGHADSAWSTALMVKAADDGPRLVDMGGIEDIYKSRRHKRPRRALYDY